MRYPKVYSQTINGGASWTPTFPSMVRFLQITNNNADHAVTVRLNNDSAAVFTLSKASTQVFTPGDVDIDSLTVFNSTSGATTATIEILATFDGGILS